MHNSLPCNEHRPHPKCQSMAGANTQVKYVRTFAKPANKLAPRVCRCSQGHTGCAHELHQLHRRLPLAGILQCCHHRVVGDHVTADAFFLVATALCCGRSTKEGSNRQATGMTASRASACCQRPAFLGLSQSRCLPSKCNSPGFFLSQHVGLAQSVPKEAPIRWAKFAISEPVDNLMGPNRAHKSTT